jgi:uncharacterized protein YodC (DUF2158 family)
VEAFMPDFPKTAPEITITELSKSGSVECRQVLGWFVEPKLGEHARYAEYEVLEGKGLLGVNECNVRSKVRIHGLDCFEIASSYFNLNDKQQHQVMTYCRIIDGRVQSLAYCEERSDGIKDFYSFKDEHFMDHWAEGENNAGMEVSLKTTGIISHEGNAYHTSAVQNGTYDVIGEYQVIIGGRKHHCVRVFFIAAEGQASDFFVGDDGRELFHRFFLPNDGFAGSMKDDTYISRFPDAHSITINGKKRVVSSMIVPEYALS